MVTLYSINEHNLCGSTGNKPNRTAGKELLESLLDVLGIHVGQVLNGASSLEATMSPLESTNLR